MEIYYGTTLKSIAKGKTFRNASVFLKPEPTATCVYIDGHWPRIEAAYEKLGTPIVLIKPDGTYALPVVSGTPIPESAYLRTAERRSEQASVTIPDDWQRMPWADLRRLAASVSDFPITTRVQATQAIEAELVRRAGEAQV